ncbi:MAG: 3-deoxy-7-phosphoheptulonate synthase [bacterium]|nr:3-deoxy-7-phosphoheptulonate synthase [bacterium]
MNGFRIEQKKKLSDLSDFTKEFPFTDKNKSLVEKTKLEVESILRGEDARLLFIIGPCSAWPFDATLEYAKRLKEVEEKVKDVMRIVMRVYIQKPRTTKGWTGPVNQPDPFMSPDIEEGIRYSRKLMLQVLDIGLPIADEALFTHNAEGFIELLSWVAIGARSAEDQEHRVFASAIDCPVGMKNPTSGSIEIGVNSVIAAQNKHTAVFNGYQVETLGNPYAHLVLRGGSAKPNYDLESLRFARDILLSQKVQNPAIMIDVSHENTRVNGKKDPMRQAQIIEEVLNILRANDDVRPHVKGFMVESFLKSGSQNLDLCTKDTIERDGLSITDPCLGWEESEKLLLQTAVTLREMKIL